MKKNHQTFIRVAGITVKLKSTHAPENEAEHSFKYEHFMLKHKPEKADIALNLTVIPRYSRFRQKLLFETRRLTAENGRALSIYREEMKYDNHLSKEERKYLGTGLDWRISKTGEAILIEGGFSGRYQLIVNKQLSRGNVYIIDSEGRWKITDIIYGFLQVLIIYYLSTRKKGLLFHSCGIKENKKGYLFAGLSRAGKSTTSRIWDKLDSVNVLNDDRIIIRKNGHGFIMHPTPWHGDYSEYLKNPLGKTELSSMFYIYHRKKNFLERLSAIEGFELFYQTLFLPFWSKECMDFIAGFLIDMFSKIPAYKFGFKNNDRIISCIRGLSRNERT